MKKKKLAVVLAILAIIFFALSIFFITCEHNHNCNDIDCKICEQIAICEKSIEELGAGLATIVIVTTASFGTSYKLLHYFKSRLNKYSLISLKTEMLD